ncbi:hypothetical protein JCM3766R1_006488 [Sporobolomyces carnicolor]
MATSSTRDVVGPDGTKFFTKTWLPPRSVQTRAVVLFVHGFIEHVRRYDHVYPLYAEKGIAVFAYDQRGFGQTAFYTRKHSQGQTTWPKQFADLDFFTKLVYDELVAPEQTSRPRYFLMGHSMGGAVVLASQTRPVRLDHADLFDGGVVSTSPLLRQAPGVKAPQLVVKLGNLVGRAFPTLALPAAVKPEDTCRDERVQREYAQDKLCLQRGSFGGVGSMLVGGQALVDRDFARWPKHVPVLVCHGEADLVTDHRASQEFVEKLKDKVRVDDATYKGFEGFYHEMQNEPGQDKLVFINYVIDWILERSSSSLEPAQGSTTAAAPPSIEVSPASPLSTTTSQIDRVEAASDDLARGSKL